MGSQNLILRKQSAAFANSNRPSRTGSGLRTSQCAVMDPKPPQTDKFMENPLLGNVETSEPLTKRELEILKLIIAGKTNKEIAVIFCRSQRTIEYHRNRLMRKFDAHNSASLVKRAIALGIA